MQYRGHRKCYLWTLVDPYAGRHREIFNFAVCLIFCHDEMLEEEK